jgi:hypothetical protein
MVLFEEIKVSNAEPLLEHKCNKKNLNTLHGKFAKVNEYKRLKVNFFPAS